MKLTNKNNKFVKVETNQDEDEIKKMVEDVVNKIAFDTIEGQKMVEEFIENKINKVLVDEKINNAKIEIQPDKKNKTFQTTVEAEDIKKKDVGTFTPDEKNKFFQPQDISLKIKKEFKK